ncbi:MAG: DUF6734 family protein [Bacteroidota bacterium]
MKIVQSLWSKPGHKAENVSLYDKNAGGWLNRKYNYMSWALSCLTLRKNYSEVELVTDLEGKELLIDQLQLPYTKVKVALDDINAYNPDLWALGKLYAYRIQKEHFIHVDGDIYVWGKFPKRILEASLLAQHEEINYLFYKDIYKNIKDIFYYIPEVIVKDRMYNDQIFASNAGIIGGTDIDFFQRYTKTAFDFIDRNEDFFTKAKIDVGQFNTFYEQYLFSCLAKEAGTPIVYYLTSINDKFDGLAEFFGAPQKTRFIHLLGAFKRRIDICTHLEQRLRIEFPKYYYRIIDSLRVFHV